MIALPAERPIRAELLRVVCVHDIPAQLIMEQMCRALLHELILRIVVAHRITSLHGDLSAHQLREQAVAGFC